MLSLPEEHHPRIAALVAGGLLAIVVAVVGMRLGESGWPGLVLAGQLLGLVGLVVFVSAGFLYVALFVRDLFTADPRR